MTPCLDRLHFPTETGPPSRCPTPCSPSYTHTHTHTHTHTIASPPILSPLVVSRGCLGTSGVRDWVLWGASWACWCMTPPGAQGPGTTCHHLVLGRLECGARGGSECLINSSLHPGLPLARRQEAQTSPVQSSSCHHPHSCCPPPASISSLKGCLISDSLVPGRRI